MGNLEFDVENRTLGSVGGRNSRRAGGGYNGPGPLSVDFVRVTGPAVACLLRAGHESQSALDLKSRKFRGLIISRVDSDHSRSRKSAAPERRAGSGRPRRVR